MEALELRFDANAGPTGALFGSVTATMVADRLWEAEKLRVDRRKLQMETIKRIGRYTVPFEVFPEVVAELRLVVAPEGEELPTTEELARLEAAEAQAEAVEATRSDAEAAAAENAVATAVVEAEVVEAEVVEADDEAEAQEAPLDREPGDDAPGPGL